MRTYPSDGPSVRIYDSNAEVGAAAARELAQILRKAVAHKGEAAVILATGNSQLTFINALRKEAVLLWDRITVFHMDEYLGMRADHPASFRRFIREKLTERVKPGAFFGIEGDAVDLQAEMQRYTQLLKEHPPVACVLGIGENGHLAFNDPPAGRDAKEAIRIVTLAQAARKQQLGEGHFPRLADVPTRALTLTIPTLLAPEYVLAVVPEQRKAEAVKAALEGPISPECPASYLRTHPHVRMYLDEESASLLTPTLGTAVD